LTSKFFFFILFGMQKSMTVSKWTISLPPDLAKFVEQFQHDHALSRSEVIAHSLRIMQEAELAAAYKAHAQENDPDREFWDAAALDDGLEEV
jgi:Arc/MetJ-type ribon-helix-helix transcriptional regulator